MRTLDRIGDVQQERYQGFRRCRLALCCRNVVFPGHAAPTDDSPTIISKSKPSEAIQGSAPSLSGNLRGRNFTYTDVDRQLSDQMSQYWVNFATTTDPNA